MTISVYMNIICILILFKYTDKPKQFFNLSCFMVRHSFYHSVSRKLLIISLCFRQQNPGITLLSHRSTDIF
jgi:hypothetical protein